MHEPLDGIGVNEMAICAKRMNNVQREPCLKPINRTTNMEEQTDRKLTLRPNARSSLERRCDGTRVEEVSRW